MKIVEIPNWYETVNEIESYFDLEEALTDKKIPCVAICRDEVYYDDPKKMFEFGHKHWKKTVYEFCGGEFSYFVVGNKNKIKKILDELLKEAQEDDDG